MSNSNEISQLSVRELLESGDKYIIPMYQRNYAWDEGEITQLIQDIIDYLPEKRNYYIGTLVVFKRPDTDKLDESGGYETIDGQQRVTTLALLASYLKNERVNGGLCDISWLTQLPITFDSRKKSQKTFDKIFTGKFKDDSTEHIDSEEINTAILNGYHLIQKNLPLKLAERDIVPQKFSNFLFDNVQIMRVMVPEDTDMNHYFEIMNNRGEQLEKHEILKSRMLETLKNDKDSQNCLSNVWEVCENMEKYAQMGFSLSQRNAFFKEKNWDSFAVNNFRELSEKIKQIGGESKSDVNDTEQLTEIITGYRSSADSQQRNEDDGSSERFNSIINFPNFLLHVLRVQTGKDIPLDDKRLISTFEEHVLKKNDASEKIKEFIFNLLRCKFLYDKYIIKREFIKGNDRWSLKRLKWNEGGVKNRSGRGSYVNTFGKEDDAEDDEAENRKILMLLSAFHVSTPTRVYKHWLNAALHYLFTTEIVLCEKIQPAAYLLHLESVAKSFVFDRFLAADGGLDYFDIIYTKKGICQARKETISEETMDDKLSFGKIENNLVFNFLDYLLWLEYRHKSHVQNYEFTFRSSVEHYYPQHPLPGYKKLSAETLHSFGNLCLISHSKNSRLSNYMPKAKNDHYQQNTIDSVKQHLMMKMTDNAGWDKGSITDHFKDMKKVFLQALGPAGN